MSDQPEVTPEIVATIGGQTVSRSKILIWEERRARDSDGGDTASMCAAIAERKLQLGHERLEALLSSQLRVSVFTAGALARLSAGR
jgi:hypothetical protein